MEITAEEFQEWKEHKITQEVLQTLKGEQQMDMEYLASGGTISKDATLTTDFLVGRIQGVNKILNIEYEEPKVDYGH